MNDQITQVDEALAELLPRSFGIMEIELTQRVSSGIRTCTVKALICRAGLADALIGVGETLPEAIVNLHANTAQLLKK